MRKLLLTTLVSTGIATSLFIACNKSANQDFNSDFVIEKNKPLTITKENGVSVTASDVFSKITSFRREISINAGKSKTKKLPNIYITFTSTTMAYTDGSFAANILMTKYFCQQKYLQMYRPDFG